MQQATTKLSIIEKIVVIIPIINIITAFSIHILGRDQFHLGHIRIVLFFGLIALVIGRYGFKEKATALTSVFLFYVFFLILYSSDFMYSFTGTYLKVAATMLMFPVGFYVLNETEKLQIYLKNLAIAAMLLGINYIIAQYFKIGRSAYLADSFYYGYAGIGSTVILSYFLISAPLLISKFKTLSGIWFLRITIFLSVLFTIIALKRIAILALAGGFLVFLLKSGEFGRGIKALIGLSLILVLTTPLYMDIFSERLEARTTERNELTQEARYFDMLIAIEDFRTKGLKHALVGTEPFNTPGYFGRDRQVHVDYANLLIGTGVIGLSLYLLIYLTILSRFNYYYRKIYRFVSFQNKEDAKQLRIINGVFWGILIASLIISFSGGLHAIAARGTVFLTLGSLTGIVYRKLKILQIQFQAGFYNIRK